MLQDVTTQ